MLARETQFLVELRQGHRHFLTLLMKIADFANRVLVLDTHRPKTVEFRRIELNFFVQALQTAIQLSTILTELTGQQLYVVQRQRPNSSRFKWIFGFNGVRTREAFPKKRPFFF